MQERRQLTSQPKNDAFRLPEIALSTPNSGQFPDRTKVTPAIVRFVMKEHVKDIHRNKKNGSHRFAKGQVETGGESIPERMTTLPEAIIRAAEMVGQDGRGKDGLVGYLKRLALEQPARFGQLLGMVLLHQSEKDEKPVEAKIHQYEDLVKLPTEELIKLYRETVSKA
jgi:hypothetical protein